MKRSILKSICAISLSLSAATAFAWPEVGDITKYELTITRNGTSTKGTLDAAVTKVDEDSDQIAFTQTIEIVGKKYVYNNLYTLSDARALNSSLDVMEAACAVSRGTVEELTVPAGTFTTCKTINGKNTQWLGKAGLFSMIKGITVSDDGTIGELSLLSVSGKN